MTPTYRQDPPQEFAELLALWNDIKTFLGTDSDSEIDYFENAMSTGSWAWDPIFEQRHPSRINRLGDVLLGPLYTSADHPWPEKNGVPMIPLLQLDLDNASKLGGLNLGGGLVQAFVAVDDYLGQKIRVRTIDRMDVSANALDPVPNFVTEGRVFASVDWAKPNLDADESPCLQITGYQHKRFSFSGSSALSEWINFEKFSPEEKVKMLRFDEILESCSTDWSGGGFHLLGTFYPIQYKQDERDWPLFCLESDHGFNFGDGQGQLFFDVDGSGEVFFYFDWSCY